MNKRKIIKKQRKHIVSFVFAIIIVVVVGYFEVGWEHTSNTDLQNTQYISTAQNTLSFSLDDIPEYTN